MTPSFGVEIGAAGDLTQREVGAVAEDTGRTVEAGVAHNEWGLTVAAMGNEQG